MEVTKDRFELPVAVADTMGELARMRGVDITSISHCVNRPKTRRYYVRKYVKVEIDDEQDGGERCDE